MIFSNRVGDRDKRFSGFNRLVRARFFALFIPLTLLNIAALMLANSLFINVEQVKQQALVQAAIEVGTNLAQHDLATVMSHLEFLIASEHVESYLNNGIDDSKAHIEREFLNLANTSQLYDQIRLIAPSGKELVRIDYFDGQAVAVVPELLQDKSKRYYFQEAAKIDTDKMYISALDLNVENGVIEQPLKPMIRFAKPLRDKSGELRGVIVLNYFASLLLDKFRNQMMFAPGEGSLLNKDGYWLSSRDPSQEWGFMLDHKQSFGSQSPELWLAISHVEKGSVENSDGLVTFATVHPIKDIHKKVANRDHFIDEWRIIIVNTYWGIGPALVLSKMKFLYPALIIYPIGLVLIWFWARASVGRKCAELGLKNLNNTLKQRVAERTKELAVIKDVTILSMATLAETRDNETGQHLRRTQTYVKLLAQALQTHPDFCDFMSEKNIDLLYKSAPLHDIGKVGIPDEILLKPSKLSEFEFEIMKRHTTYGSNAISSSINTLTNELSENDGPTFLQFAQDIAHYHHEKWDGSGYPNGLSGDDIPIAARIMAIADVFDALSCKRVYKEAFGRDKTETIMFEGSGTHFDPRMIDAFSRIRESFWEVKALYEDEPPEITNGSIENFPLEYAQLISMGQGI